MALTRLTAQKISYRLMENDVDNVCLFVDTSLNINKSTSAG